MTTAASVSPDWAALECRLEVATGPDSTLDAALGGDGVTESAQGALAWARAALPGWHLHVGFDVSGVLPYAAASGPGGHVEASAPTVPLAILRAAVKALAGHFQQ